MVAVAALTHNNNRATRASIESQVAGGVQFLPSKTPLHVRVPVDENSLRLTCVWWVKIGKGREMAEIRNSPFPVPLVLLRYACRDHCCLHTLKFTLILRLPLTLRVSLLVL